LFGFDVEIGTLTEIPTKEEFEYKVDQLNKAYRHAQSEIHYLQKDIHEIGQRKCNVGYLQSKECTKHKGQTLTARHADLRQFQSNMAGVEERLADYERQIAELRREEQLKQLDEERARQQKILEDNIKKTFEIEFQKLQASIGKERAKQLTPELFPLPDKTPVLQKLETPKDEPLAIMKKCKFLR
jgi:chromosome segregation ATPase